MHHRDGEAGDLAGRDRFGGRRAHLGHRRVHGLGADRRQSRGGRGEAERQNGGDDGAQHEDPSSSSAAG